MTKINPITQILDENNCDNITMYDDENHPIEFEQHALITLENGKMYALMLPLTPMQGVNEGEGVLFEIDEREGTIKVVNDEKTIEEIMKIYDEDFEEYDDMSKNKK